MLKFHELTEKPMSSKTTMLSALCLMIVTGMFTGTTQADAFDRKLELNQIQFHVTSKNEGSINWLTITPSGLELDNSTVSREVDGSVAGAQVADLNADGSPEIYVYITSAGSGSYGSLVAYSANNNKSISEIYLPDLMTDDVNSKGYMGHDSFVVGATTLFRRFPVYRQGDTNAMPSGGIRELQYELQKGEAGWLLVLKKSETAETGRRR